MRRTSKHQATRLNLYPLNGGINVSQPPEQIAENEMQICENFIYERDSMRLVGRGGLKALVVFDYPIVSTYYDVISNTTFVFLKSRDCYQLIISNSENVQKKHLGKVTGDGKPQCCMFKDKLFIASGGYLQFYDFGATKNDFGESVYTLTTITSAPRCNQVFYRWERLAVTMKGSDRITYSSVGDATSEMAWVENMNDDSSCKWLDIGANDGGDIIEIVPLSTDMIVFKSNGKIYQFVGDNDFNSWAVYNVANMSDMTADFQYGISATNIGQEVVFLSLRGLKTLSTTQDYGNIAATDIGSKFNKLLTRSLYEPEMFPMRRHMMIVIRPTADDKYFVAFNYGLNAATVLKFAFDVSSILETKDDVFVTADNTLYLWTETATKDGNNEINYKLSPRDVISSDELLIKAIDTKFTGDHAGGAKVQIGERLKVTVPTNTRKKILCNHSCDVMHMEVTSNYRFEVDHIALDTVAL